MLKMRSFETGAFTSDGDIWLVCSRNDSSCLFLVTCMISAFLDISTNYGMRTR